MYKIKLSYEKKKELSSQIAHQIILAIEKGDLRKGDILPAERLFAEELHVSRGTIHKAYEILKKQKCIVAKRGSHHYVMGLDAQNNYQHDKGVELTNQYLNKMLELKLSFREIQAMLNLEILSRRENNQMIKVGIIECRPSALYTFAQYLEQISCVDLSLYLIDEITHSPSLVEDALVCDIILTTGDHYFDVCKSLPMLESKLLEVVTSWSEKTIFALANIPSSARIGIVYVSPQTINIIQSALKYFDIHYESLTAFNENNLRTFKEFCSTRNVLIAEPLSIIFQNNRQNELLQDFRNQGGQIISFENHIDKGSQMLIEQSILRIANERGFKAETTAELN